MDVQLLLSPLRLEVLDESRPLIFSSSIRIQHLDGRSHLSRDPSLVLLVDLRSFVFGSQQVESREAGFVVNEGNVVFLSSSRLYWRRWIWLSDRW